MLQSTFEPISCQIDRISSSICHTISSEPLKTPHSMFENQSSSCARPSSGNSTKSARGFSSNNNENDLLSAVQFVTVGVMLRKILNPIYLSSEASNVSSEKIPLISCPLFHGSYCTWPHSFLLKSLRSAVRQYCSPSSRAAG